MDKRADAELDKDTPIAERENSLYMSTAVVAGTARAVVTATGNQTEVGRIGGLVAGIRQERTPLEKRLDALGPASSAPRFLRVPTRFRSRVSECSWPRSTRRRTERSSL